MVTKQPSQRNLEKKGKAFREIVKGWHADVSVLSIEMLQDENELMVLLVDHSGDVTREMFEKLGKALREFVSCKVDICVHVPSDEIIIP